MILQWLEVEERTGFLIENVCVPFIPWAPRACSFRSELPFCVIRRVAPLGAERHVEWRVSLRPLELELDDATCAFAAASTENTYFCSGIVADPAPTAEGAPEVVLFSLNVPLLGHWLDHVPVMTRPLGSIEKMTSNPSFITGGSACRETRRTRG